MKSIILVLVLCASVAFAGDISQQQIKEWQESFEKKWANTSEAAYNRGFEAALDCMMLLDLELKIKNERMTWGHRNDICRQRFANIKED